MIDEYKYLVNVGRVLEKIKDLSELEILESLSKHNPYWESTHEIENEKLFEIRMKLNVIKHQLDEMYCLLFFRDNDD